MGKRKKAANVAEGAAVDKSGDVKLKPSKETILKIAVIAGIVFVLAGIMIFKLNSKKEPEPISSSTADTDTIPLKVTKFDLEELKAYELPMVLDFGSDSCGPCQEMAPVLETLNEEWQGKAIVQFADVWVYPEAADGFPVSLIPTQVFFNADGTPYVPSEEIQKNIQFTMYLDKATEEHVFTVHQGGITEAQMRQIFAEMGVD